MFYICGANIDDLMKKVLVTGGTGFIGSHTIVDLINHGYEVVSVDNYINSNADPLASIEKITSVAVHNYDIDLCDMIATEQIFKDHPDIVGVIHFAALKAVGESVAKPILYFKNNLNSLLNILACCQIYEIPNLIFSSSCTVYGNADELPVTESTPEKEAESPYGRTKQIGEKLIKDSLGGTNTNAISLRYFNPAGAHRSGLMGESPVNPALNLVPVITETAIGKRDQMIVFGDDYDTRDGSCIRDYIHVMDLASAHTKALEYLLEGKNVDSYEVFNLGIGAGVSVLEAIHAFEKVTGEKLNYKIGPRRPGDVIAIYADDKLAREKLNWEPTFSIEDIMDTAWTWEQFRTKS